jgi:hypothetical protein
MHYQKDDPRFEWRLAYFQAMVLPRLLRQTDNRFDIAIRCYPWHAERLKKLSNRIITFSVKNESEKIKDKHGRKYFLDFIRWEDIIGLPQYDIQSGLDSDDLIAENYIEIIHRRIAKEDKRKSLHIYFQPELFDLKTLKIYPIGVRYNGRKGSAFFSIYQPNKTNYRFLYEKSHLLIGKDFSKSILIPTGYCWATVHNINESTKVNERLLVVGKKLR